MNANTFDDTFNENNEFKGALKWSLIFHVVVFALFTIKATFFNGEALDYSSAIRVDIVALPDKLDPNKTIIAPSETAKKKPEDLPKKKEITKDSDSIDLKNTKSKQQVALEKLKTQSALDKIKRDIEREKSEREALKKIAQIKGNILSPGTTLTGLDRLQHEDYISTVDRHVKDKWTLPEWMSKQNFKAQVRVRIDNKGQIISREIIKSSGNGGYDDIVLDTIDQSAPFPSPPEKFVSILSVQGIIIGFPE